VSEGTYSVVYLIAADFKDDFSGPQGMGEASSSATYAAGSVNAHAGRDSPVHPLHKAGRVRDAARPLHLCS
jgi:hypothetical protein